MSTDRRLKRFLKIALAGALLPLFWAWGQTPADSGKDVRPKVSPVDTLRGEVVDIQCEARNAPKEGDTARPAAAQGWNACGTEAVKRGAPVGLRPPGGREIYLVAMKDRKPPGRLLGPLVGKTVAVSGQIRYEGGLRIFEIAKLLPAAPGAKTVKE